MVGVPLQRAANFGERNVLTDEEFKARAGGLRQAERRRQRGLQHRQGDARAGGARHGRRAGVAAAALARARQAVLPGLAHRRSARRPHAAADAGRHAAAARAARRRGRARPGRLVRGSQPLRPVHHARRARLDPAGHLQQRQPDHPGAGRRRPAQRDDPRDALLLPRRPAARQPEDPQLHGRLARRTGTATRSSSRRRTCSTETASAATAAASRSATR